MAQTIRAVKGVSYLHTCGFIADRIDIFVETVVDGIEFMDPMLDSNGNVQKPQPAEDADWKREDMVEFYEICGVLIENLSYGQKRNDLSETVDQYLCLHVDSSGQ